MNISLAIAVTIVSWAVPVLIMGEIPELIGYQGRLTDDVGNPLDTTVDMTFHIFDAPAGGSDLWSETNANTVVINGQSRIHLGCYTPLDLAILSGQARFRGRQVGSGPVGTPLVPIVSTACAIRAAHFDTANYATVSGGYGNELQAMGASICEGHLRVAGAEAATVGGGTENSAGLEGR